MRRSAMAIATSLLLIGVPLLSSAVYAGTSNSSSTSTSASISTPTADPNQPDPMGMQSDVLRPGANPNNPADYAYLPPGMSIPAAGPRTNVPQAPPVTSTTSGGTSTTTGTSSGATSTSGSTTSGALSPAATTQNSVTSSVYSSVYSKKTLPDLALGKPYTIGTQWPDALFAKSEAHYVNTGQLTDGKFASLSYSDPGWIGLLRQYGRSVVVNLGSVEHVDTASLDFMQNLGAGIDFPNSVTYYASTDGTNWYSLGTAWSKQGGGDYTPQTQAFTLRTDVNAQYIRAQFQDKVFSFLDEFSVYGTPSPKRFSRPLMTYGRDMTQTMGNNFLVDPKVNQLPGLPQIPGLNFGSFFASMMSGQWGEQTGYLTPEDRNAFGVKNMQLVYTGSNGAIGSWSESDFLPMIGQYNSSGTPTGWMFDTSLFGPYSSNTPTSAAGWSGWLSNLFSPNVQLSALNQAVGSLKQTLNQPDFKEKVVITIPGMVSNPSNFGAIDPSGQNLDLNPADVGATQATINKVRAVRWYIDQVLADWQQAGLTNLSLVGFYWQPESLNVADPNDPALIQATSAIVHAHRMGFYWIPYYGAPGITAWRQLGFDNVMIQPGVSFNWSIDAALRLGSTADMAQYYHTGLEIEQHWDVVSTNTRLATIAQNKYYDYFTGGYVYGYEGNVMKSYYLNSKTLLTAYQNQNPFYHQIYDNTVSFINGKWTSTTFN